VQQVRHFLLLLPFCLAQSLCKAVCAPCDRRHRLYRLLTLLRIVGGDVVGCDRDPEREGVLSL